WAEWCGPCQQLMPMLETLANEYKGRFALVKVNVDESPEIAGAFGVQSIPFVVAMADGQPVSHFAGVQSEKQLRAWLDGFLPSPAAEAFQDGQQHEADGSFELAEACYRKAIDLDGSIADFKISLARVLLEQKRNHECAEVIEELEARGWLEPEAQTLKEQLEVRSHVEESGGIQEARRALESDPENLQLQLALAEALGAENLFEEACEICLTIISKDRGGVGVQAKEAMVGILGVMGPKSKKASEYRRRLATAFY
ncbi:MAG: tetratricopeptide repeat protein, partial [Planctomycetaceae bacterium]|nr:tetratricopeptide repeat protein [Planctomycetaceae bacterium]